MEFKAEDLDDCGATGNRLVSAGGLVEIMTYRVLYGWRVRAGFVGLMACEIDLCGGADWPCVVDLYSIVLDVLRQRPEDRECFDGIPCTTLVKPVFRDADFLEWFLKTRRKETEVIDIKKHVMKPLWIPGE